MCKPRIAYFTGHFEWATVTNTVSTPSWFTSRKSVKPSNFDCPSTPQNPIELNIDKCLTSRIIFGKWFPHLLPFDNLYLSLQLSVYPTSYMTLPHSLLCIHPSLCYPTGLKANIRILTFQKVILNILITFFPPVISCISRQHQLYRQTVPVVSADIHNGKCSKITCVCLTTSHYTKLVQFVGNNTTFYL